MLERATDRSRLFPNYPPGQISPEDWHRQLVVQFLDSAPRTSMTSWEDIRSDAVALRAYLDGVDARLAGAGVAIHARSVHAWMAVQRDMKVSIPLGHPSMTVVNDYFAAKYGRRGLMDVSVGRMLVVFGHDPWVLRFPLVYGTVRVDLLRMIEDGTPDVISRLSASERSLLNDLVPRAFEAFDVLKRVPTELRADWAASVDQAVDPRGDLGLSRWSSQQVIEKLLKAFIRKNGGDVPHGRALRHPHELEPIAAAAEALGLRPLDRALLAKVECRAGVRYPENSVTLADAVGANQASVLLAGEIAKQW